MSSLTVLNLGVVAARDVQEPARRRIGREGAVAVDSGARETTLCVDEEGESDGEEDAEEESAGKAGGANGRCHSLCQWRVREAEANERKGGPARLGRNVD